MTEPTPGPGADLKAAREGLQVSIREVADALNLPARVIESLETDDYERLPPTVFTRGYLRSYARLLELPADALLARYPEVTEEVEAATDTRTGSHSVAARTRPFIVPGAIGVIVIVVVLAWLFTNGDGESPPVSPATGSESVTAPDDGSEEAAPERRAPEPLVTETQVPLEREAEQPAPVAIPTEPPAEVSEPVSEPPGEAPVSGVEPVPTEQPAPAEADTTPVETSEPAADDVSGTYRERRITEFGDDRVVLTFAEDCWVEVKSLDGENLYSDLNRAGATLVLTGRAPFRLLLGYAPGATLEFNGEAVALSRYSRNNVASVVLGQ